MEKRVSETSVEIWFGKHKHKTIENIPTDYLKWLLTQAWLIDSKQPNNVKLVREVEGELKWRDANDGHWVEGEIRRG
jgi:uncharacterized protein (DUF3820 family)